MFEWHFGKFFQIKPFYGFSIAPNNATAAVDRVPLKQKLAYGLGGPVDILAIWVFVSIAYPVLIWNSRCLRQEKVILMALRRDGIVDPVMGWISIPHVLAGAPSLYLYRGNFSCNYLPFNLVVPMDLSHDQLMIWVIGFGILFYTCFTTAVPFQSLLMEMTPIMTRGLE